GVYNDCVVLCCIVINSDYYVVLYFFFFFKQKTAYEMLRRAWGIGPGRRGVHPLDDIWRTVEEVRALPDFAVLTDALEQFRALLGPVRRRRRAAAGRGVERLVGWETGSDLERVIPEESARLADPDQ